MVTLTTSDKDQAKLINNRQNGRRRGRGGQQPRNGQPGNVDRGNRIDNRARGNAAQLLEKYRNLARDAQTQGDRVNTEYYLQFADHYFRVLSENRARFEEQRPNGGDQRSRGNEFGQDGDDDGEGQRYDQADGNWGDDGDDRPQERAQPPRQNDRQNDRQPDRRPRYEEQQPAAAEASEDGEEIAPRPRIENDRRPRRARNGGNGYANAYTNGNGHEAQTGSEEHPVSERIEIDRLPQSLSVAPSDEEGAPNGEEAARPRRRAPRRPRPETSAVDA